MPKEERIEDDAIAVASTIAPSRRGGARTAKSIAATMRWFRPGDAAKADLVDVRRARVALDVLEGRGSVQRLMGPKGEKWRVLDKDNA